MKNKTWLLFKIQLINQYRVNKMYPLGMLILAALFAGYSFSVAYGLGLVGMAGLIPAYAVTSGGIAAFFFTLLKTNGLLFGYRDYELLMSLPVAATQVISSRFLSMYLSNMFLITALMVPMGAGYALWTKPGLSFYLYWLVGTVCAPLIPTTAGAILGALVMAFSSRFRYAKALSTLLTVLLLVGSLVLSLSGGAFGSQLDSTGSLMNMSENLHRQLRRFYPPAGLFEDAFGDTGRLSSLLLFIGLSLAIYALFAGLLAWRYKAINSGVNGRIKRSAYHLSALKTASPLRALYFKEIKRFLSSTIYLTNAGVGAIMALIFAIAMTIMGPERLMGAALGMTGSAGIVRRVLPFIMAAMLAMSSTASSSLSLEGKNLWIIRSVPVTPKTIFDSKILVNLTLTLPVAVGGGLMLNLRIRPAAADGLFLILAPVVCALFSAVWGMYLNIKMPRYNWESEMTVVKQGFAAMAGMLGSAGIVLAAMGLTFLPLGVDYRIMTLLVLGIIGGGSWGIYKTIGRIERI